ncbi:MAG: hypothetical protein H2174_09935 [Vampirovibrio sp.]|nr:hypothetical protein [Vampirovibrio sp.]
MMMMMSFTVPASVIGTGYYLDHFHGAIAPTATRANVLIAVGALGVMAKDVFDAKTPEERKKRLRDDTLRIGLPTLATLVATQLWMKPEGTVYNTTQPALNYFAQHYGETLIATAQEQAKAVVEKYPKLLRPLVWGELGATKTVAGNLTQQLKDAGNANHPLLDIQIAKLIEQARKAHEAFAKHATPQQIYDRFTALQASAEQAILARAEQAEVPVEHRGSVEALKQLVASLEAEKKPSASQKALLEILETDVGQLDWVAALKKDANKLFENTSGALKKGIKKESALNKLFHNELRLLLPTAEELGELKGNVLQTTAKEFVSEAAVPFMLVGGASVLAGISGGLMANKLNNAPSEKNMDVVKEGIFQYVANIVMCGMGAGVGLLVANLAGFTKQEKPLLRFGTIVAGLAAGIATGAAIANPLCSVIEKWMPAKHQSSGKGRKLEWQDAILHVDDVPTAFSVAGVQALKPLLPMFFIPSGLKAAIGYRNEEPLAHLSPFDECLLEPDGRCPDDTAVASTEAPLASFQTKTLAL